MSSVYLLDTNAVSAVMADNPKFKAKLLLNPGQIVTCATVRGEIRYGLERLPTGKRRSDLEAKAAIVFGVMPIEPITQAVGDSYGVIRRQVEINGHNLSDNDLWIAASALVLHATLVTNDHAFTLVPGLVVEDWIK